MCGKFDLKSKTTNNSNQSNLYVIIVVYDYIFLGQSSEITIPIELVWVFGQHSYPVVSITTKYQKNCLIMNTNNLHFNYRVVLTVFHKILFILCSLYPVWQWTDSHNSLIYLFVSIYYTIRVILYFSHKGFICNMELPKKRINIIISRML